MHSEGRKIIEKKNVPSPHLKHTVTETFLFLFTSYKDDQVSTAFFITSFH
jgi:hypothetical protein